MSFYLNTPVGDCQLQLMQEICISRVQYLNRILHPPADFNIARPDMDIRHFAAVACGTAMDRTAHFFLRLFAAAHEEFSIFFIDAETRFFASKLKCDPAYRIVKILQKFDIEADELLANLACTPSLSDFSKYLLQVKQVIKVIAGLPPIQSQHCFQPQHSDQCEQYKMRVTFTLVPDLVARRQVYMVRGEALVECRHWPAMLEGFFKELLRFGVRRLQENGVVDSLQYDERHMAVTRSVFAHFPAAPELSGGFLACTSMAQESQLFPACMFENVQMLIRDSRLPHSRRLNLTAYLRDLNMPVGDALKYWEFYYNKTASRYAQCDHSWAEHGNKYIYSIKHMYGLEGKRQGMQMPDCQRIQEMPEKGGCPYKSMGSDSLRSLLSPLVDASAPVWAEIDRLREQERYKDACNACRGHVEEETKRKTLSRHDAVFKRRRAVGSSTSGDVTRSEVPSTSGDVTRSEVPSTSGDVTRSEVPSTSGDVIRSEVPSTSGDITGSKVPFTSSDQKYCIYKGRFSDPVGYYKLLKAVLKDL